MAADKVQQYILLVFQHDKTIEIHAGFTEIISTALRKFSMKKTETLNNSKPRHDNNSSINTNDK